MSLWIGSRDSWTRNQLVALGELHEKYRKRVWSTGWYIIVNAHNSEYGITIIIHRKIWSWSREGSAHRIFEKAHLLNIIDELIDMKLTELGI